VETSDAFKGYSQGPSAIYVISGGTGAIAEKLVQTVLVQFPEDQVPVLTFAHVCETEQLEEAVAIYELSNKIPLFSVILIRAVIYACLRIYRAQREAGEVSMRRYPSQAREMI